MKVLMTADPIGGVWTYALELARALAPRGVRVGLATMGAPLRPEQRSEAEEVAGLGVFESLLKLEWMDDPWEDVARAGDWLLGLEEELQPDLVHLGGYAHGALSWQAPTIVAGHSCVLSWWQAVKGEPAPASWARYRAEVGRGLRAAKLVVAPTAAMLTALERHYGPLSRTRVIPNGRRGVFAPAPKEPFVLTAGRLWDKAKNVAVLTEVAPRLSWPVLVAGDARGPDGRSLPYRGLEPLGRLPEAELAAWMGRAAVYALPARYEPFGLSALEAALSGCALVVSDIASLREVWGEAALYAPPNDPEAWTAALNALSRDEARRDRLARHARERALRLTPEAMAQYTLAAYESLVAAPPSRATALRPTATARPSTGTTTGTRG